MDREEAEQHAKTFSDNIDWWEKQSIKLLDRSYELVKKKNLSFQEKNEFLEIQEKLAELHARGLKEIEFINQFIEKLDKI
jgi:hypothetical protein